MKNQFKKLICLLVIIATLFAFAVTASAFDKATEVKFDQVVYESITDSEKEDYYKFTLTTYGRVFFNITTGMRPFTLTVYNEKQEEVWKESVNKSLTPTDTSATVVLHKPLDAGNYFLKITGTGKGLDFSQATGDYNVKLTFKAETKPADDKDTAINNSLAAAIPAVLEKTTAGKLLKDDEEDFYQVVIPSSGTLEFKMLSKMQWYSAALLNQSGSSIWSTEQNEWDSATKQRKDDHKLELSAGTYYIKVNGKRASSGLASLTPAAKGSYQFELYFTSAGQSTTEEPNNSIVEAKKIAYDVLISDHLSITDNRDFFEITVPNGDSAIAVASNVSSYSLYIYDEYGAEKWSAASNALEEGKTSRNDVHEFSLAAGKYYLAVKGGAGKYSFILTQNTDVATVTGVKGTRAVNNIQLRWTAVKDAAGYEVYKFDEEKKEFVKVASTTGTSVKIKNLKAGTNYDFKVRASRKLNGSVLYGEYSDEFSTTTVPAKAVISKVTAGKSRATVAWTAVEGASGYRIFYARNKDFDDAKRVKVKDGKATKKVIKKLKKGKKYYFKVRAYKTFNGKNIYGALSRTKGVKIKK